MKACETRLRRVGKLSGLAPEEKDDLELKLSRRHKGVAQWTRTVNLKVPVGDAGAGTILISTFSNHVSEAITRLPVRSQRFCVFSGSFAFYIFDVRRRAHTMACRGRIPMSRESIAAGKSLCATSVHCRSAARAILLFACRMFGKSLLHVSISGESRYQGLGLYFIYLSVSCFAGQNITPLHCSISLDAHFACNLNMQHATCPRSNSGS
jgi:hypothetical protein